MSNSVAASLPWLRLTILFAVIPWPTVLVTGVGPSRTCCAAVASAGPGPVRAVTPVGLQTQSSVTKDLPAAGRLQVAMAHPIIRRSPIAYGDQLKVTFLETVGVPVGRGAPQAENVVATIFPRTDLSAEIMVDENGEVVVSKLGQFTAVGRTLAELQADLASAFKSSFGRPCDVEVAISSRQPVYVMGDVRAPGVFRFSPGMIVMQVLASAGGTGRGPVDTSRSIENVREMERLRKQESVLTRLLIKQARLAAERENAPNLVLPSTLRAQLSQPANPTVLVGLIESAALTLAANRDRARAERTLAQRQIDIAQNEVKAHTRRLTQLQDLLVKKQQRLADLKQLASRGSVPQYNVLNVDIDISDSMVRLDDEAIALAQAERRVAETQAILDRLIADASAQLESDWVATLQEIAECNQSMATMAAVVKITLGTDAPSPATDAAAIVIIRRTNQGLSNLPATESTALEPGDVVRIGSARPDAPVTRDAESVRRSVL